MKRCSTCGVEKPLDEFHRDKRSSDGHKPNCKPCRCEASRQWLAANPEKARAASRRWAAANRDHINARNRQWREQNPETQRNAVRRWHRANVERSRKTQRAWYKANRERHKQRVRKWRQANHEAVRAKERQWVKDNSVKRREYQHRRRVALNATAAPFLDAHIADLLRQPCDYCGVTENITVDHIVPLARGGTHKPENLAPACRRCNSSKGAKLLSEWPGPDEPAI